MTSPEHQRPGEPQPNGQPDAGYVGPSRPSSESTPRRAPSPAAPTPPVGAPGFFVNQDQQSYDDFYRHVYGETAPPGQLNGAPTPPWPQAPGQEQRGYPDPRYAHTGAQVPPYDPRLPTGQAPYYPARTPDRDFGLALGLTAVGFLGVAGLQYFYIGKIGKGVAYLLTAGWFGIGTVVSLFTVGDEVIRTNDERRRGLR